MGGSCTPCCGGHEGGVTGVAGGVCQLRHNEEERLRSELCRMREAKEGVERELNHFSAKTEDEMKHLRLEVEAMGAENDRVHQEMHSLQTQMCAAEDKIHELEHRLKDALQVIGLLESNNYEDQIAALQTEIRALKATIEKMALDMCLLEGERDELGTVLDSREGIRQELECQVFNLQQQLRTVEIEEVKALNQEIEQLENQMCDNERAMGCVKKESEACLRAERGVRMQLAEAETHISGLEHQLGERERQAEHLNRDLLQCEKSATCHKTGLIELQRRIDQLVDENLTLNAIVATQQAVTEEAHKTTKRLQKHLNREIDNLRNDLDNEQRNRVFLAERIRCLEAENEKLQVETRMAKIRSCGP